APDCPDRVVCLGHDGRANAHGVDGGHPAALYGTLYVLLQLEAFALLVGTAALFVGLIALMVTTRSLTGRAVEPA
ncbi:MAG: inner membrane CreD family protein, partial [Gammaproteobacteria bacterium]